MAQIGLDNLVFQVLVGESNISVMYCNWTFTELFNACVSEHRLKAVLATREIILLAKSFKFAVLNSLNWCFSNIKYLRLIQLRQLFNS